MEHEIIGRLKVIEIILAQSLTLNLVPVNSETRKSTIQNFREEIEKRLFDIPEASRPYATKTADWILGSAYKCAETFQL